MYDTINSKIITGPSADEVDTVRKGMSKANNVEEKPPVNLVTEIDTGLESVFCCKMNSDGDTIAAASSNGKVKLLDINGRVLYKFTDSDMPTTHIAWRPRSLQLGSLEVLVTVNVYGEIKHWHVPTQKQIFRMKEENNEIYILKYRPDGRQFATAGKDCKVRIYDEETKKIVHTLERGIISQAHGHSNRIFACKYKPDQSNILVTGGWDNTVLVWDLRQEKAVKTIYGPHIAGDALDISGNTILTGSWRPQDALECWDINTGKNIMRNTTKCPMVYCAQFLPNSDGNMFVAGGVGRDCNELRMYSKDGLSTSKPMNLAKDKGIYTCDVWNDQLVIGGDSGSLRVFSTA